MVNLELKNTEITYNGKPILKNLCYGFPENSITCILGASGSGKTTLLRSLSRLNDRIPGFKVRGEVWVAGTEIYLNGVNVYDLRRKVGMIFQSPCVFPKSIYENVIFGYKYHHPKRKSEFPEIAERYLKETHLWDEVKDRLKKPASILSQGQKQRLSIARTLALEPEILLMDEPTSSLDPVSVEAFEQLILSLKEKHTILMATHNIAQTRRIADEVVFLHEGQIWDQGPSATFFEATLSAEAQRFLEGDRPRI
ncbi:MAG: phosphate ABC transporter ATP-binding protein [Candidatus Nitrohelix vancouverensis]|uniref:Phosphate ABC transporter ATP-binding protein n=1 Tax=Candidatus Nitrohelix vancouverensis TaxID=2705534 RepID=A0A7T0C5C1_9BACT|nr:MAG: phosphate ABC transporter ATP-binding protein [Candidatus Nitrohelix vancouverensis]